MRILKNILNPDAWPEWLAMIVVFLLSFPLVVLFLDLGTGRVF